MPIRNRELSQFGSFITIDDTTQSIGIGTTARPYVGIGTTNPVKKLHVVGDTKIDGGLDVSGTFTFDLGKIDFSNPANDFDIYTSGVITATSYYNTSGGILTSFDSWGVSGSNIYRQSGNVGVGSTNPQQKLDVLGNVQASGQFISNVAGTRVSGTPPFQVASSAEVAGLNATYLQGKELGGVGPGDIVSIDGTQTLTNKTFGGSGVIFQGSSSGNTTLKATSAAGSGEVLLPTTTGTLICSGDTGTVTSNMILNGTILNEDISTGAGITYGKLNLSNSIVNGDIVTGTIANNKLTNSTISGVSLGSDLAILQPAASNSYILIDSTTGQTGVTTYNGRTARTIAVDATDLNTASKVVARDSSGDFKARTITLDGNLSATSGTVSGNTISAGTGGISATGAINITNTTDSTNTTTGALRISGGAGIQLGLNVGTGISVVGVSTFAGITTVTGPTLFTKQLNVSGVSTFAGITTVTGPTLFTKQLNVSGVSTFSGITTVTGETLFTKQLNVSGVSTFAGITTVTGETLFTKQLSTSGITSVTNSQNATSTTTGALRVTGGVGIVGDVYVGGTLNASQPAFHVQHQTSGNGGTFTSGAWQTRTLTTLMKNTIGVTASFDSNQITLPSGTYEVDAYAIGYNVNNHQTRIQSISGVTTSIYGSTERADTGGAGLTIQTKSTVRGTIVGPVVIELQHQCENPQNTNGFGRSSSFASASAPNVYADVFIRKIG